KITWRHLANMISCYGVSEQPGTAFDYNDYNIALLRDLLIKKVYRSSYERMDQEVLHPAITDLLDCQDNPTLLAFGIENRPGRLAVSVRDFARFGLLYLRDGNWQGRQLISREHVDTILGSPLPASLPRTRNVPAQMIEGQKTHGGGSNQAPHDGSYSFLWWVNGVDFEGRRHWPEAPEDTYMASGHWGPRTLVVIPSLKLVVSWNDAFPEHWDWNEATMIGLEMTKKALGILVRAVNE
ncbi:MAG: hypothetical protein U9N45_05480, partial [Gemmatimonadota bacterium]|nr:hypothetical protein [Gemmatimonadota bacterium]